VKKGSLARLVICVCLVIQMLPGWAGKAAPLAQISSSQAQAAELLASLTPEEKVGQLFLVTFNGPEAGPGPVEANKIYDLITNYHVGGVILEQKNNNFVGSDQTIPVLFSLTDQLQRNEYNASLNPQVITNSIETFTPAFIPLFIGVAQGGDGYPYDQILNGLTTLPNQMTIGATWDPEQARRVGSVLGTELNILGINLLLGPSLDVLQPPYSESGGDLGVRTFGGDPFWVSEMGRAYVSGLHQGSSSALVVVGKHFPGFGGSDRLPEDDVATVRKNLEQLKQFELYPFSALTGSPTSPEGSPQTGSESTLDALLTAHIRFQGFQENFRQQTKPISFDREAFSTLMELPAIAAWRTNGGVMISDSLGSRAVRRFYDPTGQTFSGRTVALDAFLAGNDMLYLSDFVSSGDDEAYTTIRRTISAFARKYREDPAFAQRVDASVLRILTLKFRLYGDNFSLSKALPQTSRQAELGQSRQVSFEIAQKAATLISPLASELDTAIPGPNDQIVFLSDARTSRQCAECAEQTRIDVNGMGAAVTRLYGAQIGGPIRTRNLYSYSFTDLVGVLNDPLNSAEIEKNLQDAEWLVFLSLDLNTNDPSTLAMRRLLDERPDLLQGKRIIGFAMNAPYFLGTTDLSKLSAYYSLYSHSPESIEVAARLLFQEIQPAGNLPVSMPGIGYDLNKITFPNPTQVIPLSAEIQTGAAATETPQPGLTQTQLKTGDLIALKTGVLLDHNNHPVPDGTIVRFIMTISGDTTNLKVAEAETTQGVAQSIMRVDSTGDIEIRAESDPAVLSDILRFVVPSEAGTPNPSATITQTPTSTPSPTPTTTATPTLTPTLAPTPAPPQRAGFGDWVASMILAFAIGLGSIGLGMTLNHPQRGLRAGFMGIIGAALIYSYLRLGLPGASAYLEATKSGGTILAAFSATAVGVAAGWLVKLKNKG